MGAKNEYPEWINQISDPKKREAYKQLYAYKETIDIEIDGVPFKVRKGISTRELNEYYRKITDLPPEEQSIEWLRLFVVEPPFARLSKEEIMEMDGFMLNRLVWKIMEILRLPTETLPPINVQNP